MVMTVAKNSVKKVTSHLLTAKNKMLRKKAKYDPKYSGKPTIVDNVAGNLNFRLCKQLPSLSGVVILVLIGYIAYEQIGPKRSATSILDADETGSHLQEEKGKVLVDAPVEILDDVRKVGRVDHDDYNEKLEDRQNPKIKGVNDMRDHRAMPLPPKVGYAQPKNPRKQNIVGEYEKHNAPRVVKPNVWNDNKAVEGPNDQGYYNNREVENAVQPNRLYENYDKKEQLEYENRLVDNLPDPQILQNMNEYHPKDLAQKHVLNQAVEEAKPFLEMDYNPPNPQIVGHGIAEQERNDGQGQFIEDIQPFMEKPNDLEKELLNQHPDYKVIERFGKKVEQQVPPPNGGPIIERKIIKEEPGKFVPMNAHSNVKYPEPKHFPVRLLQEPKLECSEPLTLLILVHTQAFNFGHRRVIRETWGVQNMENFARFGKTIRWKTLFIMGKPGFGGESEKEIQREASQNQDILQGDFVDSEHENTRKLMMAMRWLYSNNKNDNIGNCQPTFLLKSQDNIFHNMFSIIDWLGKKFTNPIRNIYMGRLLKENVPIRDPEDPLNVPYTDYHQSQFPVMIEAPVYLFDYNSYKLLASRMSLITPIAMEDGFIAAIANRVGLKAQHNDHFMMLKLSSNHCHNLRLFFLYDITPGDQKKVFHENKNARTTGKCKNAHAVEKDGKHVAIEM